MVYTEQTNTSYGSRIGNSIKGVLFGIILIIASVYLLWWNEGRTIKTTQGLVEGEKNTVTANISPIDNSLNGKLVWINGKADTKEILNDKDFFIKVNAIKINRKVEMYQWKENKKTKTKDNLGGSETKTTTYTYNKIWSPKKINSELFKESGHENLTDFKYTSQNIIANNVLVGDLQLSPDFVEKINKEESILIKENDFKRFKIINRTDNIKLENNSIYIGSGSINNPEVGDLKITFSAVYPSEVSIIGKQEGSNIISYKTKVDTNINLLQYGKVSIEEMYKKANDQNKLLAWGLRGLGLLLIFIGFNMIFGIIVIIFKIIPFLADLVNIGTGLISLILTLILGGGTIIIAWLFVRPFISIIILLIIGLIIYLSIKYKTKKSEIVSNSNLEIN